MSGSSSSIPKRKLFISGIPRDARLSEVLAIFERYGPIMKVEFPLVRNRSVPSRFVFVEYYQTADATEAFKYAHGKHMHDKDLKLRVEYAKSDEERVGEKKESREDRPERAKRVEERCEQRESIQVANSDDINSNDNREMHLKRTQFPSDEGTSESKRLDQRTEVTNQQIPNLEPEQESSCQQKEIILSSPAIPQSPQPTSLPEVENATSKVVPQSPEPEQKQQVPSSTIPSSKPLHRQRKSRKAEADTDYESFSE